LSTLGKNDEIIYIGVGAGKNPGKYEYAGLGNRLHKYHEVDWEQISEIKERKYKPTANYNDVNAIITYTIEKDYAYLSYSLESFLISKIKPKMNNIGII